MLRKSIIVSLVCAVSLNAGMFGDVAAAAVMDGGSGSSVSASEVQNVLMNFQDAEKGLQLSIMGINSALGDKQKIEEFAVMEKKISGMGESAEKDAARLKLYQDELAYTEAISKSKEIQEKAKNLSQSQKAKVGISIGNLLLVALKDAEGLLRARNLAKSISSNKSEAVRYAIELPKINTIVQTIPNQVNSLATINNGLTELAKNADIEVIQPTSFDQPFKEVSIN